MNYVGKITCPWEGLGGTGWPHHSQDDQQGEGGEKYFDSEMLDAFLAQINNIKTHPKAPSYPR